MNKIDFQETKKSVKEKRVFLSKGNIISYEEWVFEVGLVIEEIVFKEKVTHYKLYWKWIEKALLKSYTNNPKKYKNSLKINVEDFYYMPAFLYKKLKDTFK